MRRGGHLFGASPRCLHVVAGAAFLLGAAACGGSEATPDAAPVGPPDASAILTIGDICVALTDVTCRRDAECFDFFAPPCDQSYYEFCCMDDGICAVVNGVIREEVDTCIAALEVATCDEIESDFPSECVGITSQDGPTGIATPRGRGVWSALNHRANLAALKFTERHQSGASTND